MADIQSHFRVIDAILQNAIEGLHEVSSYVPLIKWTILDFSD
jgi:hypothetical protein